MVKTAPDDPDCLVTELARNAIASDASQLPLKEILAILPLPASFLPRKTLILTATAAHLIKPSTLGFIRSHENSSVYSPTMRQVIVQKLYHGTAKKLPKMLTGPCYAFMPLAAPDHRNVGWIATHRLVDYAITNRQHPLPKRPHTYLTHHVSHRTFWRNLSRQPLVDGRYQSTGAHR